MKQTSRVLMAALVVGLMLASIKVGVAEPLALKDKKIIGFAPDLVDTRYLKENIAELERIPIDGLFISVQPDWRKIAEGDLYLGRINPARGVRFRREDYQQAIADLKETKFNRFTDNFIDFSLCARNAYDWFDANWSVYAENAAVLAYVAKQGGLKGLVLDVEQYGGRNVTVPYPFSYKWRKDRSERSFDEVADQVRKRGRQFMEAIVAEYPDITILMIPSLGWDGAPEHPLLPAFADGMLEGMGPRATLIDGMENAYPLMLHENFSKLRQIAEKDGAEKSSVPELYKRKVQYGFGVWVDFGARPDGAYDPWYTDPKGFEKNYRSPQRLEHSLFNALTVSDRYVWLFMIHPQMWWQPHLLKPENVAKQMEYSSSWRCKLCPHSEIPKAYLDAIRDSHKPHDLRWAPGKVRSMENDALQLWCRALAKGKGLQPKHLAAKGPNILKNGGFESWDAEKGDIPNAWNLSNESHRKLTSSDDAIVKEGSHSLKIASTDSTSHVYFIQHMPAAKYAGKTITFGVWVRTSGFDDQCSVNVIDFIETTGRNHEGASKLTRYEGKDGWWFITATKTIRKNAIGTIRLYLDSSFPPDGGTIYYDGAIAAVEE